MDDRLAEERCAGLGEVEPFDSQFGVVAPRGTPRGETELMVGGVVRLPVGQSEVVLAGNAAAEKARARRGFIAASLA